MKVAFLIPINNDGSGGFSKHICEVVPRWLKSKNLENVNILVPTGILNEVEALGVHVNRLAKDDYRSGFAQVKKLAKENAYDVVFCAAARPVKLDGCPVVTMVRNIEPIQTPCYPMPLKWRIRLWILRHEHSLACRQATRVIGVSNYVKQEVSRRFRIQLEKIDIVYHGYSFSEQAVSRKPAVNIPEDFLFSAGSFVPYRGYEDILRALAEIKADGRNMPTIVLAGSEGKHTKSYGRFLKNLAKSLCIENNVICTGHLQREEMNWCYRNARMFIQTSRAETFSNIQVEAMAHGCVCISCDHPPMPEIFDNAALFYKIGNSTSLSDRIRQVLNMTKTEAEGWSLKAVRRASFFSWDKTAQQTLEVLERAIKEYKG